MLDVSSIPEAFLDPVSRVVDEMLDDAPELDPGQVMLVGAWCRDVLHVALGHAFELRATRDVDLALALSDWQTYDLLARAFPRAGHSGVRFTIAGIQVDLLPFGSLENPRGSIIPPTRGDPISVWAFDEIHRGSTPLALSPTRCIRIPTVPGYAAAKLAAWLDRSARGEVKDANDLALTAYWYSESQDVASRLYGTSEGQRVLVAEGMDLACAAVRLLGCDVAAVVGRERVAELVGRWPGDMAMLRRNFRHTTGPLWLQRETRRGEVISALTRGLSDGDKAGDG